MAKQTLLNDVLIVDEIMSVTKLKILIKYVELMQSFHTMLGVRLQEISLLTY